MDHNSMRAAAAWVAIAALASSACGVGERQAEDPHVLFAEFRGAKSGSGAEPSAELAPDFEWPAGERAHAELSIAGRGSLRVALYPEIAPETVAHFEKLANEGFYDGTAFHRVIPGFMIQGGDPNTRDDDPDNDGRGGPGYTIGDEFSNAPFQAGVLAMANKGKPNTAGSQFFIVHQDSPHLRGKYTVFGRVVAGQPIVDAVAQVETDAVGRWGPKNRPIEPVVLERVRIVHPDGAQAASDSPAPGPAQPSNG